MATPFRLTSLARLVVGLGSGILAACAGQGTATQMPVDAPVKMEVSQLFMTVENNAGLALTDVTIGIVPYGGQTEFLKTVGRLDSQEKRDVMLADFRGRDGTRFQRGVVKPKSVRIVASDLTGKKYEIEYPWK